MKASIKTTRHTARRIKLKLNSQFVMVVRPYKHVVSPTPKGKETIANNLFLSSFRVLGIP